MSAAPLLGILALFPAAALFTAWPRRRWASWASAAGGLLFWLVGFFLIDAALRLPWLFSGLGSIVACLYASFVVTRNASDYDRMDIEIVQKTGRRDELARSVEESRVRIRGIETEQREVLALYSMIKGLAESLNWEDVRPKLDTAIRQYLGVEEFVLFVSELKAQDRLTALVKRKLKGSPGGSWETLSRLLQEQNRPFRVPHRLESPERAIAVPIFENRKLMGYLYALIPPEADPAELLAKAQGFVEEITFAFRRVKLFQEVDQNSQLDGLTGVYRRGMLDRKLEEEAIRAGTFRTSFCLMLLDIDHFKSLNDKYGHQFGDQVLQRVGEILKDSVYETDFVARYGGEEFAVVLPRADPIGVLRKAEALRAAIEANSFEYAMQPFHVTVSIGVAHFPRDGASPAALVRQADQALYRAKETGRNRVVDLAQVREQT